MSIKATAAKKRAPKAKSMLSMKSAATRGATKAAFMTATSNGKCTLGKCHAMGSDCTLDHLQNNRHHCANCGDGVHAIEPCGKELKGKLYCMNCCADNDKENQLVLNQGNCPAMGVHCLTH